MNVEIETVAAQFLFWKYLFRIVDGIGSLQCDARRSIRFINSTHFHKYTLCS
jgi:hypothetical protein